MGLPESDFRSTRRFDVRRRLGEGGMGVVYEAWDRERRSRVALKTLRTLSPEGILRFKNEFRGLQDLSHRNLCTLGELICDRGQWFFTMELVDGVDLLSWVRPQPRDQWAERTPSSDPRAGDRSSDPRGGDRSSDPRADRSSDPRADRSSDPPADRSSDPRAADVVRADSNPSDLSKTISSRLRTLPAPLDARRLRASLLELARGVTALHAAGVVHRDIKPSNILVEPNGRVVLLDFGLAMSALRPDQSDVRVVGTADYMAPEQASAKKVGPEADWYSVGVVLYEALTGGVPFGGAPLEVLLQKQAHEPPPARALAPDAPADLDEICAGLLRRDPKQRFGARELHERLMRTMAAEGAVTATPSLELRERPRQTPFVGRREELSALEAAFEETRAGAAVSLHVHGESGVGKSALVRYFVGRLRASFPDVVVLQGRCYERESVPYKAVDGVVDALARWLGKANKAEAAALLPERAGLLAEVFPVLRRVEAVAQAPRPTHDVDPQLLRQRLFASLRELLARLAARRPLVLVVDDLQWADADSLALLDAVTQPPGAPPMLLLATVRVGGERSTGETMIVRAEDDPSRDGALDAPPLRPFLGAADTRVVQLPRLNPDEACQLAAALLSEQGASSSTAVEAGAIIAEEAGGHPLFIDELVRHAAAGPDRGGPVHLDEALRERVRRLDPVAQRLLELVTVAGGPLAQQAAARAADLDFSDFAHHAATLRAANLVRTSGARPSDFIEPYHDRVRAAVQAGHSPAALRRAHERVALGLESTGRADPEALAAHWQGAGDNDKAAAYAAQAAERASKALAFERAAQLYRQTLLLRAPGSADAYGLQVRLGDALAQTGRGGEAARAYLAAAERASAPADGLELRRRASEQLLRTGHIDDGMAALQPVLAAARLHVPATPRRALFSMSWRRGWTRLRGLGFVARPAAQVSPAKLARVDAAWSVAVGLGNTDLPRAGDFAARHLLLALAAGEPTRVARALAFQACLLATQGHETAPRVERLAAEAQRIADGARDPHAYALSVAARAISLHMQGRWRACLAGFDESERLFRERCTGVAWELSTGNLMRAVSLAHLGELSELAKNVTRSLQEAEQRGDLYGSTALRMGQPNLIWLVQDLPDEARGECEDAITRWSTRAFHSQHATHGLAMAQIELYQGAGAAAYQRMQALWPQLQRSYLLRFPLFRGTHLELRARAALAAARAAQGSERQALMAAARGDARRLACMRPGFAGASSAMVRAGLAHLEGDDAAAATLLADAGERYAGEQMAMHAAIARGVRGRLIGGDEGRALTDAMAAWMGAQHVAAPDRFLGIFCPGF